MIKYKRLPENITELLPKAIFYLNSQPEIQFVYLFGGLAKGDPSPLSEEENIRFGVHIERNPITLYFLEKDPEFRYSGKGSGIPRVIKSCDKAAVNVQFTNDKERQQFRVTFFRI